MEPAVRIGDAQKVERHAEEPVKLLCLLAQRLLGLLALCDVAVVDDQATHLGVMKKVAHRGLESVPRSILVLEAGCQVLHGGVWLAQNAF